MELDKLFEYLSFPSVSAGQERKAEVRDCAGYLMTCLSEGGMDKVELWEESHNLVVFAEKVCDPSLPTILVYGHLDVQPAEPLEDWISPPFKPEIRNGRIYARGAADNKAQFWIQWQAIQQVLRANKSAYNFKIIVEAAEETGSTQLDVIIAKHRERLKADMGIISDTAMHGPDRPAIVASLRGIVYAELGLSGLPRDLHSGIYGGAVINPANALMQLWSKAVNENGEVLIDGFYEKADLEEVELEGLAPHLEGIAPQLCLKSLKRIPALYRASHSPSVDVHGIQSGWTGKGPKTIIPQSANLKFSIRLSGHQQAEETQSLLHNFFKKHCPEGLQLHWKVMAKANPVKVNKRHPMVQSMENHLRQVFGVNPEWQYMGGTIPVVALLKEMLEMDTLLVGFGLDEDAIHAPNESFRLDLLERGIDTFTAFYATTCPK